MSGPGIGAMLHVLGGGSNHDPSEYVGRTIEKAWHDAEQDTLHIRFTDGVEIQIEDRGQSCCESRYMTCDDDLSTLAGTTLRGIELKSGPEQEDEFGEPHDIVFIEIQTDKLTCTVANHNEHNGWYGGFGLSIEERQG